MNHRSKALVFDLCQPYAPDGKGKSDDDEYDDWLVYTRIVAYKKEKPCLTEALEDLVTDLCVGLQPAFATDGTLHGAESLYDRYWDVNSPDISPNKLLGRWSIGALMGDGDPGVRALIARFGTKSKCQALVDELSPKVAELEKQLREATRKKDKDEVHRILADGRGLQFLQRELEFARPENEERRKRIIGRMEADMQIVCHHTNLSSLAAYVHPEIRALHEKYCSAKIPTMEEAENAVDELVCRNSFCGEIFGSPEGAKKRHIDIHLAEGSLIVKLFHNNLRHYATERPHVSLNYTRAEIAHCYEDIVAASFHWAASVGKASIKDLAFDLIIEKQEIVTLPMLHSYDCRHPPETPWLSLVARYLKGLHELENVGFKFARDDSTVAKIVEWHLRATSGKWQDFPRIALQVSWPSDDKVLAKAERLDRQTDGIYKIDIWNMVALFGSSHLPLPDVHDVGIICDPHRGPPPADAVSGHPLVAEEAAARITLRELKKLPALSAVKASMAPVGLGVCSSGVPTIGDLMCDLLEDIKQCPGQRVIIESSPFRTRHEAALCEFVALLEYHGKEVLFSGGPCNEKKQGRSMGPALTALMSLPLRQRKPGKLVGDLSMRVKRRRWRLAFITWAKHCCLHS